MECLIVLSLAGSWKLEVGTSSLASIAASVDVDLDARREMLLVAKLGKSDNRKPGRPYDHLHHLHPFLLVIIHLLQEKLPQLLPLNR